MTTELTNETKKDEDLLGGDKGILSDQSFIPGTGGLISTNIPKAGDFLDYTVGALTNARLKTYFNIQLPFILWTGATDGALTTNFDNWQITSSDPATMANGSTVDFRNVSATACAIFLDTFLYISLGVPLRFSHTNTIILDWWAILSATNTGDVNMGFGYDSAPQLPFQGVWNDTSGNGSKVTFSQKSTGELMAVIAEETVGVSSQDITSGVDVTLWNNYRIELKLGTEARFYVNGILKATLSGDNLITTAVPVNIGFGRSNNALFGVTAPNFSIEMNP